MLRIARLCYEGIEERHPQSATTRLPKPADRRCDRAGARSDLPEAEKGRSIARAILCLCSREHLSRGPNGRLRVRSVEVSYLEMLGQSRANVRDAKRRQYALTRTPSLFLRMLYYAVKTCRSFGRPLLCFVHHIAYLPIRSSGIGNSRASLVNR